MSVNLRVLKGYAYGLIQPSVVFDFTADFDLSESEKERLKNLLRHLTAHNDKSHQDEFSTLCDAGVFSAMIVASVDNMNHFLGDIRFSPIVVQDESGAVSYVLPTLSPDIVMNNMRKVVRVIKDNTLQLDNSSIAKLMDTQKPSMQRFLPAGSNSLNFMSEAAKRKIPFKVIDRSVVVYGYGKGSNVFMSSVTDDESVIGVQLAKRKTITHTFLKLNNFPCAPQASVSNVNEAASFASRFGYPAVIKPDMEEQGRGVFANIVDEAELRSAFDSCVKVYKNIIIEKHIFGDVYRINTISGNVVRVVKRIAASVVGDGHSTIENLIATENQSPLRNSISSPMVRIKIDQDLSTSLSKQGLNLNFVPKLGRRVYLSSVNSVSRGAFVEDYIDKFHRDNAELCRRVAATMRLDVTGIDFISKDGSVPWYENGAIICEVNSQPQLGVSHMSIYGDFLDQKVGAQPHIRLCVTVGESSGSIYDPTQESLLIRVPASNIIRNGCPVQYFDELEVAGEIPAVQKAKLDNILVSVKPYSTR